MNRLASQLPEYETVMAMTGIGPSVGPQLMAEIGDVRRFAQKSSLVAFAGIDPGRNGSGSKESNKGRIGKHDCFILSSEGVVLVDVFTIPNNLEGFNTLLNKLQACTTPQDSIKVGLEATGHYSYNILGFLLDNGLAT